MSSRWIVTSPTDSIVEMIGDLIRIPSQGGLDPAGPVLNYIERWLRDHGLSEARRLQDPTSMDQVGIMCDVEGHQTGPRYVLDACVDTAPFGNESDWTHPPTSATIADGWMYGRGSADSKAAIAIFSHVAVAMAAENGFSGTLTLLFDSDEHTGMFRGAKTFFENEVNPAVAGVMIGYPGRDKIVTGSRGFLRATVTVRGTGGHSGDLDPGAHEGNAVEKASYLVRGLHEIRAEVNAKDESELPATVSVTAIQGGEGWSTIPDTCRINVDMRLTPGFRFDMARDLLSKAVVDADGSWPTAHPSSIEFRESWPAYALPESSRLVVALEKAAARRGLQLRRGVVGPSNIGNYLASLGIEATAGFGVRYRRAHGPDECIDLSTIPDILEVYEGAARDLLARKSPAD
jgi:succinyl-diaminopimelate desuccinylase